MSNQGETQKELAPGGLIDNFKILRLLGKGGMGEVYLARDVKLGRKVALKMVHRDALGHDQAIERFLFEAKVTARFNHPHIVTIYAVGEHEKTPYVALEFLEGQNLRERMADRPPTAKEAARIGLSVAEALAEAHCHKVLHRDLKPENILLPKDGRLRVVDFGLAKTLGPEPIPEKQPVDMARTMKAESLLHHPFATEDNAITGTPLYMAPEQWRQATMSGATDVWALGVILYELLVGERPFDAQDFYTLFGLVTSADPLPPIPASDETPPQLSRMVSECLEKDPDQRPTAEQVVQVLNDILNSGRPTASLDSGPFRGLLPFSEQHSDLFFGRDNETMSFIERLREEPVLPVVGPSGAGKSSFVQAGVLPRLREQAPWVVLNIRPGRDPFQALASRIVRAKSGLISPFGTSTPRLSGRSPQGAAQQEQVIKKQLLESPESLTLSLLQISDREQARVLLFVDQLEELETLVEDHDEQLRFMEAICTAADDPDDPIRVVFTLRDDFMIRLAETERARKAMSRITVLSSPGSEALKEIITKPLTASGYRYDEGLAEEMVAEVDGETSCLPLLQFACNELWTRRDKKRKLITREAYEKLGGVGGALAKQADSLLDSFTPSQVELARSVFLRLVSSEGTRKVVPRSRLLEDLPSEAEAILDRLVDARSVILRKGQGATAGSAEVEIVHESLIDNWGRLRQWIEAGREDLAFLAELEQAALLWERRGHNRDEVWKGVALHDALEKASRLTGLPTLLKQFLDAGLAHERSRTTRKRAILGVVFSALIAVAAILAWQNRQVSLQKDEAVSQHKRAESERAEALIEGAKAAAKDGSLLEARAKLRMSLEAVDSVEGRALFWRLSRTPSLWRHSLYPVADVTWLHDEGSLVVNTGGSFCYGNVHTGEVTDCKQEGHHVFFTDISPDHRLMAMAGTVLTVLDRSTTTKALTLEFDEDRAYNVAFSPKEKILVATTVKNRLMAWDTKTFQSLFDLPGTTKYIAFNSESGNIFTLEKGGIVAVRNPRSGEVTQRLEALGSGWAALGLSPDGKMLAVGNPKGEISIWCLQGSEVLHTVALGDSPITRLLFGPKGDLLFSGDQGGSIRTLNTKDGTLIETLTDDMKTIATLELAHDDEILVAGDMGGGLQAWTIGNQSRIRSPLGHDSIWLTAAMSQDGELLASAANSDDRVLLWEVDSGRLVSSFTTPAGPVYAMSFSHDGEHLAVAGNTGVVALHDPMTGKIRKSLYGHDKELRSVTFNPSDKLLASGDTGGSVMIWDVASGTALTSIGEHGSIVGALAFSPGGEELASAGAGGKILLRNTKDWTSTHSFDTSPGFGWKSLSYSNDGSSLAFGNAQRELIVYDREENQQRKLTRFDGKLSTFFTQIDFAPNGNTIAVAPGDGLPKSFYDVETGNQLRQIYNPVGPARVLIVGPNSRLAAVDDATSVRLWNTETGLPWWKAPLMTPPPRLLYTHRGWLDMSTGQAVAAPEQTDWRKAVTERTVEGDISEDGKDLCLITGDSYLEHWDADIDRLVSRAKLEIPFRVKALPGGCVSTSAKVADPYTTTVLFLLDGKPAQKIEGRISSVSVSKGLVYLGSESEVHEHSLQGRRLRSFEIQGAVTGVARVGDEIAVAYFDGAIDFYDADTLVQTHRKLKLTPPAPVELMLEGPGSTLITSSMSGAIDLWHLPTNKHLDRFKLNGRISHLKIDKAHLFAATVLGDHDSFDLSILEKDRCHLLERLWGEVSVVWSAGRPVVAPPPKDHPCVPAKAR